MYLEKIVLNNFRCFEKLEVNLDKMLTVVVGANGDGKTSLLEGMAIAISTMFTALDGVKGRGIDKSQAHLKAYAMGSTSDVQPQYPVTISAFASGMATAHFRGSYIYFSKGAVSAPAETYGKDANGILRCIMRVKERPQIIIEKFELFYHLLDEKNYKMAEQRMSYL